MKSKKKGFTLIEISVVTGIIGILAAFAVAQYFSYIARTQVTRVMFETSTIRMAIEDCKLNGTSAEHCYIRWKSNSLIANTDEAARILASTADTSTVIPSWQKGLSVSGFDTETPVIKAIFSKNTASPLHNKQLTWMRKENGTWDCAVNVNSALKPSSCRN